MSLWRHVTRGLRRLVHPDVAEQDLDDELQHYVDQATAEGVALGLTPAEAWRSARAECGSMTVAREKVRGYGWEHTVDTGIADIRYAVRRVRNAPGFAAVSVLTLAVAIGATTAIFSAVDPILFEPLPYPHADRILMISDVGAGAARSMPTFGTYEELAKRSRSFVALAATNDWEPALSGTAEPERVQAQEVSAPYFRVWGVAPAEGRDFTTTEDVPNGPRVAVVSAALAERRFGSARAAVGQQVTLDGDPYMVIGVMPVGFKSELAPSVELWVPLQYQSHAAFETREWGHHLRIMGRLRSGASSRGATAELEAIARTPVAEFARPKWADLAQGLIVHPLQQDVTSDVRPALLAILGAVFLVLAIAGVNVTNLLLARAAQRRGEFTMRVALGAGRSRLVRQLLTESVLLAAIGGVVGLGLAWLGVRTIAAVSPASLPRADAIRLDVASFVFALAITTAVGLLVGLAPALTATRGEPGASLHEGSRRTAGGHQATRRGLVVAEVALALVLLVSAGLLLRSLGRLLSVPPGFDPTHLITMQVEAAGHTYDADDARYRFFTQALDAVHAVPGVSAAAFTTQLPLSGDRDGYGVTFQDLSPAVQSDTPNALRYVVTPGYLQAMHIPLRRGRLFDAHDVRGAPRVAIISESLAKLEFPGQEPIGQHLKCGPALANPEAPWATVVGVVGDVTQESLAGGSVDEFYIPEGQWSWVDVVQTLVVHSSANATALVPSLQRAIWSVDRNQPITRIATMDALISASTADRRFALILFEAFGAVALALAAIGIYGVLSGSVNERAREIGVRTALGASRTTILALVGREGMVLTAVGIVIGLAGACGASRAIASLLFGVTPLDPVAYGSVVLLLSGVAAAACWIPAWRAARVDPSISLRLE